MKEIMKQYFEEFTENIEFPTMVYTYESGKIIAINQLARDIIGNEVKTIYRVSGTRKIALEELLKNNGSNVYFNREYSIVKGIMSEIDVEYNLIHFDGKYIVVVFFDYSYKQSFVRHREAMIPRIAWKDTKQNFVGMNESLVNDLRCLRAFTMPAKTTDIVDAATAQKLIEDDNYVISNKVATMNTLQLMKSDTNDGYFCSVNRMPLINSNGSVAGLIGSYSLIFNRSEHKEVYDGIMFRNNILCQLISRSDTVILSYRKDTDYHLEFVSSNISLYGYNIAQLYKSKIKLSDIVRKEDYNVILSFLNNHTPNQKKYLLTDIMIRTASGEKMTLKANIIIVKEINEAMYFICIFQKYTEESDSILVKKGRYHLKMDSWEETNRKQQLEMAVSNQCREFSVFYQPIVSLENMSIMGAEALLRWNNPSLGEVKPLDFLSMSEYLGLMGQLGDFVLKDVVKTFDQIRKQGNESLNIHVNISMMQLYQSDFIQRLTKLVDSHSIPRQQIVLEIKEALAIEDIGLMQKVLMEFKKEGFSLALDNFGAGFVDVHSIMNMPFDYIKLDKKFMESYGTERFNGALVAAMLDLIKSMKAKVIVEGVETLQQYEFLLFHEVQAYQGFYHSKPLTRKSLLDLLKEQ